MLGHISPISPPYLACICPVSPPYLQVAVVMSFDAFIMHEFGARLRELDQGLHTGASPASKGEARAPMQKKATFKMAGQALIRARARTLPLPLPLALTLALPLPLPLTRPPSPLRVFAEPRPRLPPG